MQYLGHHLEEWNGGHSFYEQEFLDYKFVQPKTSAHFSYFKIIPICFEFEPQQEP